MVMLFRHCLKYPPTALHRFFLAYTINAKQDYLLLFLFYVQTRDQQPKQNHEHWVQQNARIIYSYLAWKLWPLLFHIRNQFDPNFANTLFLRVYMFYQY